MIRPRLAPLLLLSACALSAPDTAEVERLLADQAACWNRGDLPGFVASYWQSEALSFMGAGGVTRGARDLLAMYERGYPDAATRGQLSFRVLEVRPLDGGFALVLGEFALARAKPDRGFFTLLVERRAEGLRIAHDHTTQAR